MICVVCNEPISDESWPCDFHGEDCTQPYSELCQCEGKCHLGCCPICLRKKENDMGEIPQPTRPDPGVPERRERTVPEAVRVPLNTAVIVAALVGLLLFSLGTVYGRTLEPKLYTITPAEQTVTTPSTTVPVIAEVTP